MTSDRSSKLLAILDLFDSPRIEWSAEEIAATLGFSRSSVYRYLGSLCEHGLLAPGPGNSFVLGPKVFTLEYRLRSSDPLISAGRPMIEALVAEFGGTALINRMFREFFLCVDFKSVVKDADARYHRGQPLPMVRGANARAIQAFLPRHKLLRLFETHRAEFAESGIGPDFSDLQASLRPVRHERVAVSDGERKPGFLAIAAPVLDVGQTVIGSVSFVIPRDRADAARHRQIVEQVRFSARVLENRLAQEGVNEYPEYVIS